MPLEPWSVFDACWARIVVKLQRRFTHSDLSPDHPGPSGTHCNTNINLVVRGATRYTWFVIRSFRHKGVEGFFRTGSKAGIQAAHAPRLARQLAALNVARQPPDMNVPGWGLHPLKGKLSNHWSVSVSGNWRLTFTFIDGDAELVDY
jgi:toxin HigB-1